MRIEHSADGAQARAEGKATMKDIRLEPAHEFGHKVEVNVMDHPEGAGGKERKRCGITVDYGWRDIRRMIDEGKTRQDMMDYYKDHIYNLVRVNISQDWNCTGGMEEVLEIVGRHIDAEMNK